MRVTYNLDVASTEGVAMRRQRGRKVPDPLPPGTRKQLEPGALFSRLDPVVFLSIQRLAEMGQKEKGRGVLVVEVNQNFREYPSGIESASFMSIFDAARELPHPGIASEPLFESLRAYDMEKEYMVLVFEVTPGLPGPQIWFDLFPHEAKLNL
jgi:hypothetical protein